MTLNDLLQSKGIDPETVLVMRHRPPEPELNKVLPWLAADRPEVFNAYQQSHGEKVEKAVTTAKFIASFIGHEAGKALFVGLFTVNGWKPLSRDEFWRNPQNAELRKFGMQERGRESLLWFDLSITDFYAEWKGKLIVSWPPPERSWWRRAERNVIPVAAILEESAFDPEPKVWDEIVLTWEELSVLPPRLRAKLSEWRAIYYIFDTADGKGYVGSAYGGTNLLGRWLNYGDRGHGGNVLLRQRDPKNFCFSILQRVSPDMEPADVIRLEGTWKERLHTRQPFGLNDN
jgi:hypothetical protein